MFSFAKISFVILFLLCACSEYKSLYKENLSSLYQLETVALVTDKKKVSDKIKKDILKLLPIRDQVLFIVEIQSNKSTSSTISNVDTQISGYEIEIIAEIKIYKREKDKDTLVYTFTEKESAPYNLTTNRVLSILANRNNAENLAIKNVSKNIYDRLILFLINEKKNAN